MEQPIGLSTNSVPRAFFPRVAIGCRFTWRGPYLWLHEMIQRE